MDLKQTCTEIIDSILDLWEVPKDKRAKLREQANQIALTCFVRVQLLTQMSEQDIKILELKGKGQSSREIGVKLYLSHRTIESHMYKMRKLFGCKNEVQLIKRATDYKII
jgi:DNA-binding CsgD family transcriptional regulator